MIFSINYATAAQATRSFGDAVGDVKHRIGVSSSSKLARVVAHKHGAIAEGG